MKFTPKLETDILEDLLYLVAKEHVWLTIDNEHKGTNELNVFVNLNDTFGYACADLEEIPNDELVSVIKDACAMPEKEWISLYLWAQKKRDNLPFIEEVQKEIDDYFNKVKERTNV